MLAVVMPSSASASIPSAPKTRVGNFELHEPALIAFAVKRTVENHRAKSILCADLASQHSLRWKGMWRFGGGDNERWKIQGGTGEFYAYEGADRIAVVGKDGVDPGTGFSVPGPVLESYLFAGV